MRGLGLLPPFENANSTYRSLKCTNVSASCQHEKAEFVSKVAICIIGISWLLLGIIIHQKYQLCKIHARTFTRVSIHGNRPWFRIISQHQGFAETKIP